jgi:hypothetical protein
MKIMPVEWAWRGESLQPFIMWDCYTFGMKIALSCSSIENLVRWARIFTPAGEAV